MRTATPTPKLKLTCTPAPAPAPAPTHTQTQTHTCPIPVVKELTKRLKMHPRTICPQPTPMTTQVDNDNDVWEEFDRPIINLIPDALEERKVLVIHGKYGLQGFMVVAAPPNDALQTKAKPRSQKAKAVGKSDNNAATATTSQPKKKRFKPWRIPDLICSKWLYCSDWKEKPENKEKTMDEFEDHWAWFEKNEKDELHKYQELSHKKNSKARNNA
ncbi:hypothetical protein WG66_007939 [Moniliophthora roreri]|nr:hypothetical protein WG66_007939 [Moniliophthora roreri]